MLNLCKFVFDVFDVFNDFGDFDDFVFEPDFECDLDLDLDSARLIDNFDCLLDEADACLNKPKRAGFFCDKLGSINRFHLEFVLDIPNSAS